jgi:urea transport system substrate-binding protein
LSALNNRGIDRPSHAGVSGLLLFPPFRLDTINEELWRDSQRLAVRPKTFAVLSYLAHHPQRLVTKEELLSNVWARVAVNEELLRGYVRELRVALGDDAKAPRYLATVPRRGYKFLPEVIAGEPRKLALSAVGDELAWVSKPANGDASAWVGTPGFSEAQEAIRSIDGTGHTPPGKAPFTVGILHSLTGMMAGTETPVVDATLLAIEEINRCGGLGGHRIEPIVADGQSDEQVFAREATRLIEQKGASTIFGCWTSASRKAVREVVEDHDALLIYPVQFEGMEQSPNIIYTGAAPNQQILPAVRWAFGFLRHRRFFLVGSDSVFSWAAHAMIRDEIQALGGEIVGEEYLVHSHLDLAKVVRNIARTKPDMILNCLGGELNILYSRALRAAGVTPDQTPSMYFCVTEIELLRFSHSYSMGDYGAWNYFQSVDRAQNRAFVDRFRSRYGQERVLADPMEAGYLGVHLWGQAVAAAGTDRAGAVREALRTQTFDAPEGPVRIDPESQYTWKTMRLGKIVSGGQFEVIWSSERPVRPEPFAGSRSPASWTGFLADLFQRWDGHWTRGVG